MTNLFTPAEAAERLRVKSVTVVRLYDSGALHGIVLRRGLRKRTLRFREEDIEKFLTARANRGAE